MRTHGSRKVKKGELGDEQRRVLCRLLPQAYCLEVRSPPKRTLPSVTPAMADAKPLP